MGQGTNRRVGQLAVTALIAGGLWVAGAAPAAAGSLEARQWGLQAVGAPAAWARTTGAGVRIGIVDTGVDADQEDLAGKVVAATTILSDPSPGCAGAAADPDGADDDGHGTHVAGIAAASGRYGVSGVAPGASLVVAKVLDCDGTGNTTDVENGILWVAAHGAQVINLSLGDQVSLVGGIDPLNQAITEVWARYHAISVIAAGNNSNGLLGLGLGNTDFSQDPAVVVAATGPDGSLASYSNTVTAAQWGIAAPGGDDPDGPTTPTCGRIDPSEILSTYWTAADATTCDATDEGTSMATPFVSGTLALLLGEGLDPEQAVSTLLATASHPAALAASGGCGVDCAGFLDTAAAVASGATTAAAAGGGGGAATTGPTPAPAGAASNPAASAPAAAQTTTPSTAGGSAAGRTAPRSPTTTGPAGAGNGARPGSASHPGGVLAAAAGRPGRGHATGGPLAALLVAGAAALGLAVEMTRRALRRTPAHRPGGPAPT